MEKLTYKKWKIALFIFVCIFSLVGRCQQNNQLLSLIAKDSITIKELNDNVSLILNSDSSSIVNDTNKLILIVKLYNTICENALDGKLCNDYAEFFTYKYRRLSMEKLEAKYGPTSVPYSKKHNLFIGIDTESGINKSSYFEIKKP